MTTATTPTAADILVELDHRGILIAVKGEHLSLQPGSKVPAWLMEVVQQLKADLMALLAAPRRRWREQAEALIAGHPDDDREDLLHLFDEREAISSVDGGQDDHHAGQLAYQQVLSELRHDLIHGSDTGDVTR